MTDLQLVTVLSLIAGALALDESAALQVMVSQPIVSGGIAGAVAGDLWLGLSIGATLQLVWAGSLPVGSASFPDVAVASVAGVGVAALLSRSGLALGLSVAAAVFAALLAGMAGRVAIAYVRRLNVNYANIARSRAERADPTGVRIAVTLGIATRFAAGAATAAVFLALGGLAARPLLLGSAHAAAPGPFPMLLWAAPVASAAIAFTGRRRIDRVLMLFGFLLGLAAVAATR